MNTTIPACLQAFRDLSRFLAAKLASISAFRAAQQDWAAQLEALYSTPAVSEACEDQLQQLQRSSRLLLQQVQQIQVRVWVCCYAGKMNLQMRCC